MNDAHRIMWVDVQISVELMNRVTERCKTLGISVNQFLSRAIEGAMPAPDIRVTPPKLGPRKKK